MRKKAWLVAVFALFSCLLAGGNLGAGSRGAFAEGRDPFLTAESYNKRGGVQLTEKPDHLALTGGDGGAGYKTAQDASSQVSVDFSTSIPTGDNWACVGFLKGAGSANVTNTGGFSGLVVMFRNLGNGSLRADVYRCTGSGFEEKCNINTGAQVDRKNTLSLKREGTEYILLLNNQQLLTKINGEEKNPVSAFFSESEFAFADGTTFVNFGLGNNCSIKILGCESKKPVTDVSNWISSEGGISQEAGKSLKISDKALCKTALNAACVETGVSNLTGSASFGFGISAELDRVPTVTAAISEESGKAKIVVKKGETEVFSEVTDVALSAVKKFALRAWDTEYRVELNGAPVGYAALSKDDFAGKNGSMTFLSAEGTAPIILTTLESSSGDLGKGDAFDPRNWKNWKESVAENGNAIDVVKDSVLNTGLSTKFIEMTFRMSGLREGERASVLLSATATVYEPEQGGARGIAVQFVRLNGKLYANGFLTAPDSSSWAFSSFPLNISADGEVTLLFKSKAKSGMVLMLNGSRVQTNGKDAYGKTSSGDIASSGGKSFLGVKFDADSTAEFTLLTCKSQSSDSDPIVEVPTETVPEGAIGMNAENWLGKENITVNPGGTLAFSESALLAEGLDPEYVRLRLELQSLSEFALQDSWFTIALNAGGSNIDASSPDGNKKTGINSVVLMFKNHGGVLQMGAFYRVDDTLNSCFGLMDFLPTVAGTYSFEFSYQNNEFKLFVNGEQYLTAEGGNPFSEIGKANFVAEDGKTYLGFCAFTNGDKVDSKLAKSFSVLGIENVPPDSLGQGIAKDDYVPLDPFGEETADGGWLTKLWIGAGISLAGGAAVGLALLLLGKKFAKGGKTHD